MSTAHLTACIVLTEGSGEREVTGLSAEGTATPDEDMVGLMRQVTTVKLKRTRIEDAALHREPEARQKNSSQQRP